MNKVKIHETEYIREGRTITWYFKGKEEGCVVYATEQKAIETIEDLSQ